MADEVVVVVESMVLGRFHCGVVHASSSQSGNTVRVKESMECMYVPGAVCAGAGTYTRSHGMGSC